ncbi:MAG: nucleotidyltransferase family protein [Anaerolineae bacterium]
MKSEPHRVDVVAIRRALAAQMPELRRRYRVKALGLFGSVVRSEAGPESDLDVLVEFDEPPTFFQFIELEDQLSEYLGMKVDLVMKNALKPHIGQAILKEVLPV